MNGIYYIWTAACTYTIYHLVAAMHHFVVCLQSKEKEKEELQNKKQRAEGGLSNITMATLLTCNEDPPTILRSTLLWMQIARYLSAII